MQRDPKGGWMTTAHVNLPRETDQLMEAIDKAIIALDTEDSFSALSYLKAAQDRFYKQRAATRENDGGDGSSS